MQGRQAGTTTIHSPAALYHFVRARMCRCGALCAVLFFFAAAAPAVIRHRDHKKMSGGCVFAFAPRPERRKNARCCFHEAV